MRNWKLLAMLGLAMSLNACDWITSHHDDDEFGNESFGAEGKAEAGQVSVKAPGLDVTFSVPKSLTRDVKVRSDITSLYPQAKITGMYAAGGGEKGKETEVEFRFSSTDKPALIAAWYRDPARVGAFKLDKVTQKGAETLVRGTQKNDGKTFKVQLGTGPDGRTDGRLVIHDKG
ncbi:MAG: hypothetical protein JWO25_3551 [Alphaproteobacteria bacterium]|nr:hypothetical protein [Alphaproteobacteria bacterium]